METFHLGYIITFGDWNLLWDCFGDFLTGFGGISFATLWCFNFSLCYYRLRMLWRRLMLMIHARACSLVGEVSLFGGSDCTSE